MFARYWINAQGPNQFKQFHGMNVLCDLSTKDKDGWLYVYPTSGPVISFVMNSLYLSSGWQK